MLSRQAYIFIPTYIFLKLRSQTEILPGTPPIYSCVDEAHWLFHLFSHQSIQYLSDRVGLSDTSYLGQHEASDRIDFEPRYAEPWPKPCLWRPPSTSTNRKSRHGSKTWPRAPRSPRLHAWTGPSFCASGWTPCFFHGSQQQLQY